MDTVNGDYLVMATPLMGNSTSSEGEDRLCMKKPTLTRDEVS
jgi:hypothetical protein